MAKTKGPGPVDPAQSGRVLDLRSKIEQLRQRKVADVEEQAPTDAAAGTDGAPAADKKPVDVHGDAFQPRSSGVFLANAPEADRSLDRPATERGGNLKARLTALGVKGGAPIKAQDADRVRSKDTPLGKVLDGVVKAETAQGLQKLDGVVKAHEIGLQESRIKSADLLVLKSLLEVGRFTIEGSPTLQTTDALSSLETAGSVYIGFNAALQRVQLNLKRVDVLIIEGNPALREILLPKLEVVTRYLHIHDNANLAKVVLGAREKPVQAAAFELLGNAKEAYPGIFIA